MRELAILVLFIVCWWLWAEMTHYKQAYHKMLEKPTKKDSSPKKEEESPAIEYDSKIPHPFK